MKLSFKVSSLLLGVSTVGAGSFLWNQLKDTKKEEKILELPQKKPIKRGYKACIESKKSERVCNWLYPKDYRYLNL